MIAIVPSPAMRSGAAMKKIIESIGMLLGRDPVRPTLEEMTPECREMTAFKRSPEQLRARKAAIKAENANPAVSHYWRNWRWATLILVNIVFVVSYRLDIQMIEGALTAARVFGFHFADLNSSLQLMLAHKHVVINLLIGTLTVLGIYLVFGGRSFCSWVCPYHLLSEWAEKLHLKLADKKLVTDHKLHRWTRGILFIVFSALAFFTGYTVYETINPVGIVSRALTYGSIFGLIWVALLLGVEILWSRRFWCRYVCPIGLIYGIAGIASPVRIRHNAVNCLHEGKCRRVCLVPHVLDMTKIAHSKSVVSTIGADCTRCGMCVDVCPTGALSFEVVGVSRPIDSPARERSA